MRRTKASFASICGDKDKTQFNRADSHQARARRIHIVCAKRKIKSRSGCVFHWTNARAHRRCIHTVRQFSCQPKHILCCSTNTDTHAYTHTRANTSIQLPHLHTRSSLRPHTRARHTIHTNINIRADYYNYNTRCQDCEPLARAWKNGIII